MNKTYIPSYRNSAPKTDNRNWKAGYADCAVTHLSASTYRPRIYTLCGGSLEFEKTVLAQAVKQGISPRIESFIFKPKMGELQLVRGERRRMAAYPGDSIKICNSEFSHENIKGLAAFVDFDTCSWLYKVGAETVRICNRAHTVALTVVLSGQGNTPYAAMPDGELTMQKCTNPDAIVEWLEKNCPDKRVIGVFLYKNPGTRTKVGTFIISDFEPSRYATHSARIVHESFNQSTKCPRKGQPLVKSANIDGKIIRQMFREQRATKDELMSLYGINARTLGAYLAQDTGKLKARLKS